MAPTHRTRYSYVERNTHETIQPFDQRFITAMTAHHNGAIAMAKDAQTKAEHQEIKQLAAEIITAQETEVAQMQLWNKNGSETKLNMTTGD